MTRYKFANPSLQTEREIYVRKAKISLALLLVEAREEPESYARGISAAVRGQRAHDLFEAIYER